MTTSTIESKKSLSLDELQEGSWYWFVPKNSAKIINLYIGLKWHEYEHIGLREQQLSDLEIKQIQEKGDLKIYGPISEP